MENPPENLQTKELHRAKAIAFFKGCQFKKCFSPDCKNYLGENTKGDLRADPDVTVNLVLQLIGEESLQIDCVIPETPLSALPEAYHQFSNLFSFNFNRLLNQNSKEKAEYFAALITEINEKLMPENVDFKQKTMLYFEENAKHQLKSILNLTSQRLQDYDCFEVFIGFFFAFQIVFDFDLFLEEIELKKIYRGLNFDRLYSDNFERTFANSQIFKMTTKVEISKTNENLQNLLTMCLPVNEYLTSTAKIRYFSLQSICNSIEFLLKVNSMMPNATRLPLKEFISPAISEDTDKKAATIWFIQTNLKHPTAKVLEKINIKQDENDFNFMHYPFLFSVDKRVDVLSQESYLVQNLEIFNGTGGGMPSFWSVFNQGMYLSIKLRRDHILEDALNQLRQPANQKNLRKQLKVTFKGEPGVDEGGVKKEFFSLLTEQLFDPNFGMFLEKNQGFLWFNSDSFECNLNFELVGTLLGLALYNEVILSLKFPSVVYKKLVAENNSKKLLISDKIGLEDLAEIDQQIYNTMKKLLEQNWEAKDTGLFHVVSYESLGEVHEYDLIENGSHFPVTESNKKEFVALYIDWYFNKSVAEQFKSFSKGFFKVVLKESFELFTSEDLHMVICGSPILDFEMLKKTTRYENYSDNSKTIQIFWEILLDHFDEKQKREFLKFLTGSDRAPIRGLGDIKMIVTKTADSMSLPSSHTCFNHLILPDYADFEKTTQKLLKAIENSEGFGLF